MPLIELKDDPNKTGSSETIAKTSFPKPQVLVNPTLGVSGNLSCHKISIKGQRVHKN